MFMRTAILSVILLLPATLQAQNTRRIEPAQSASHSNPVLSKTKFRTGQTFAPNQPLDAISAQDIARRFISAKPIRPVWHAWQRLAVGSGLLFELIFETSNGWFCQSHPNAVSRFDWRNILEYVPLVSITRLRVRSWRYLLPFLFYAIRSSRQAKAAEGNLAVSLLRDAQNAYWTRTVWTSEEAMKSFMLNGPHRQVMSRLLEWCDEAAVVHWTQESDREPDWQEAHRRIQQKGRRSKVNHPSQAHEDYEIPKPTTWSLRLRWRSKISVPQPWPNLPTSGQAEISRIMEGWKLWESSRTCKPNSVRRIAPAGRSFLLAAHCWTALATYPEVVTHRADTCASEPALPPYLVLLRVGFALPASLLPRRCALTAPFHPYLNVAAKAVCFLWHWPSSGLESAVPDVIRHTALRSSDFPPSLRRATVRSGC